MMRMARRRTNRHVQERRRLTMSSSRRRASSVPNRLGPRHSPRRAPATKTPEQIAQARRYHRPAYLALAADLLLGIATLAVLAVFARRRIEPWWLGCALLALATVAVPTVLRLPLAFWRGYLHERRFGFSTQ